MSTRTKSKFESAPLRVSPSPPLLVSPSPSLLVSKVRLQLQLTTCRVDVRASAPPDGHFDSLLP